MLRPYQLEALEVLKRAVASGSNALCVIATGGGKTVVMESLIKAHPNTRFLVLMGRVSLLEQTYKRFNLNGIECSQYCASNNKFDISRVTVAMIQSVREIESLPFDCLIIDEVHNAISKDTESSYNKVLSRLDCAVIGFTATPYRSDSYIYGEDKMFRQVDYYKPISSLIEEGYLVRPIAKKTNHQFDVSKLSVIGGEYNQAQVEEMAMNTELYDNQITDALSRLTDRQKVFWFCSSIRHADSIRDELCRRGEKAVSVHSKTSSDDNKDSLILFEQGDYKHLTFVSMLTEGYDYPKADALVILRAVRSPVLYVQSVGRVLRPYPEKHDALVLDYGRVFETLGDLENPLIQVRQNKSQLLQAKMKFCPGCYSYLDKSAKECPDCEMVFVKETRGTTELSDRAADVQYISTAYVAKEPVFKTMKLGSVVLSKFVSKKGNSGVVVTYKTSEIDYNDFFAGSVKEYFMIGNQDWAYKYLRQRMSQLSLDKNVIDSLLAGRRVTVDKPPAVMRYAINDKGFINMVSFSNDRERDRASDSRDVEHE